MKNIVEICCGGYYDAKQAFLGGADRIELNSGLFLGGLTPSIASLELIKEEFDLKTICMVRPRGAGFYYIEEDKKVMFKDAKALLTPSIASLELIKEEFDLKTICMVRPRGAGFYYIEEDKKVMFKDAKALLKSNADGIAFGFLDENKNIDIENTKKMIDIIKSYDTKSEVVFHRAFDCVSNPYDSIERLINLGVDRLLTSGLKEKAFDGMNLIKELNEKYGDKIEVLIV